MKKRPTMCQFEDCEWTAHKDDLCRQHWRTFFGHEARGHVFGRCEICKCPIDAEYTADNYCPTKLLEHKEDIMKGLKEMESRLKDYVIKEVEQAQEESVSEVNSGLVEAAEFLAEIMAKGPPCPDCGNRGCTSWFRKWFDWITTHVLGNTGMINVLYALLVRQGGEISVPFDEAISARDSFTRTACYYDREANELILTAHTFDDERRDEAVVVTARPDRQEHDAWPDLVIDGDDKEDQA